MLENLKNKVAQAIGNHFDRTADASLMRCTWTWHYEEEMPKHMQEQSMQPIELKK